MVLCTTSHTVSLSCSLSLSMRVACSEWFPPLLPSAPIRRRRRPVWSTAVPFHSLRRVWMDFLLVIFHGPPCAYRTTTASHQPMATRAMIHALTLVLSPVRSRTDSPWEVVQSSYSPFSASITRPSPIVTMHGPPTPVHSSTEDSLKFLCVIAFGARGFFLFLSSTRTG
jgi:hypothetical protein